MTDKLIPYLKDGFVYLTEPEDMRYFAGFTGEGAVLISKDRKIILTDGRYMTSASRETSGFEIVGCVKHGEFIKENKMKILFKPDISYKKYETFKNDGIQAECLDINFDMLRRKKTADEIVCLKKAAQIADEAFLEILTFIDEGMTEKEVAARLDYIMALKGSEKPSFDTICIGGVNTCMPHGVPSDYKFKKGDFITMDFGATYKGYHSDMTRTVALGDVDEEMALVYEVVHIAQSETQKEIKAGLPAKDADKLARDIIAVNGFGEYFVHSTGHGVGLKIHEYPNLSQNSDLVLEEGDVVTVEPGIYIPEKFGVRIENTVIVTANGAESLQNTPKELIIL